MTENKRFMVDDCGTLIDIETRNTYEYVEDILDLLNELNNEKEKWKSMCMSSSNENSLLWNEISILREQGAEPSDAFKKYLYSISTEYTKFWQRKLEKVKKDGVI